MRYTLIVALTLSVLLLPAQSARGFDDEMGRGTLRGLSAVMVLIEGFDDEDRAGGYDESVFKTDVELKLRMAGIKVLSAEPERLATRGGPTLYVNVAPVKYPTADSSYTILLMLTQRVTLERNGLQVSAATWWTGSGGVGGVSYVRERVGDQVDRFVNAWLSVNPKMSDAP